MRTLRYSFIVTIYNEEKTIKTFLDSILLQTKKPNEVIIADGGSSDKTIDIVEKYKSIFKKKRIQLHFLIKPGNRSVGRNAAIKKATGDIILCSDAGNTLDKNWIKEIIQPFGDKSVDVVAGYYKGQAKNVFQKCVIPYALVMEDKTDPNNFLPATRSVAFKKTIWKKIGGFNETYSHNEDYVFAKKLKDIGAKIYFAKDAIVNWYPRNTFKQAFTMMWRFAYGDGEAGILRPKVFFVFLRYLLGLSIALVLLRIHILVTLVFILAVTALYSYWAVRKNYKYVQDRKAFSVLPRLQFTADAAVLSGTSLGLLRRLWLFIKEHKALSLVIALYVFFVALTLRFGTPNPDHPFLYNVDEWHQLMAMKAIVKHGTTTIAGAAHIPFLFPVLSGIYLIPFTLLNIVDPFSLKSPFDHLMMQQTLFEILRSVNFIFGIGSILLIYKIAKDYIKIPYLFPVFFFAISPILIALSGFFKYDVGLLFFTILGFALLLRFGQNPTKRNYIYAAIGCGLAMATKFSAIPLLLLLLFAFFWFSKERKKYKSFLFSGLVAYILTFIITGIPSVLIGKADYRELLYSNLISGPKVTEFYNWPEPWWQFLLLEQFPIAFGHGIYFLSFIGSFFFVVYFLLSARWRKKENRSQVFLLLTFLLFLASLIPLQIGAASNRVFVLLPFITLLSGMFVTYLLKHAHKSMKVILSGFLIILVITQILEVSIWMHNKLAIDPQKESSTWIKENIEPGTTIGIENMPIYQAVPNIIVKEYYLQQYEPEMPTRFEYSVIDSTTKQLPATIILAYDDAHRDIFKISDKKDLLKRMDNEGYKRIKVFTPDMTYFKYIGNEKTYFFAGLNPSPLSIAIYQKDEISFYGILKINYD